MVLEQDQLIPQEANIGFVPQISTFQIQDGNSLQEWDKQIYPELQRLFDTTWPELNMPEFPRHFNFKEVISQQGGSAILLYGKGKIIGCSFVYPVSQYKRDPDRIFYPLEGAVAYNSTVLVDPAYRKKGLMVPLLEQTLLEAQRLGYDYMVGHYNAATGVMPDGRLVKEGLAQKVKTSPWQNGKVIPAYTHFVRWQDNEQSENIVFALPLRQGVRQEASRRIFAPKAVVAR